MTTKYYIDKNVLGMLRNVSDELEKIKLFEVYQQELSDLKNTLLIPYLVSYNLDPELLNKYDEQFSSTESSTIEINQLSQLNEILRKPALIEELNQLIEEYNKSYYDEARLVLTQEQKNKLNAYLEDIDIQNQIELNELIEEISAGANEVKEIELNTNLPSNQAPISTNPVQQTDYNQVIPIPINSDPQSDETLPPTPVRPIDIYP